MPQIRDLLKQGRHQELWQMCCGFLDLTMEQFMAIQKKLLQEQLQLLGRSALGRKVMQGAMPETIEEFRAKVPLTTYKDYCPELLEKQEEGLPAKPAHWIHSTGRSGEYPFKWVPITQRTYEELIPLACTGRILATARHKGDINIGLEAKLLFATGASPYTTGMIANLCEKEFGFRYFPPPQDSEQMTFLERIDKGFWQALSEGIDGFFGISTVLVAIGERFKSGARSIKPIQLLRRPRALMRLTRGLIRSKLARRPMLPRDLWTIKAISSMGTDSIVYKEKIKEMWGVYPLDVYGGTESLLVAIQAWDFNTMTFIPNLNLLEFIPEWEYMKWKEDNNYQPKTVLLDEVKAGQNYELVITNFHGGPLTRYRLGDMVKITAMGNDKLGIALPQMIFERRADDLIDLGPMRLTERIIWQAIENTAIPYAGWTARKEFINSNPVLHLYIELKDNYDSSISRVAMAVYDEILKLDDGFTHTDLKILEELIGYRSIIATILPVGAFYTYMMHRQAEGADMAHLKPPHINPPDDMLELLQSKDKTRTAIEAKTKIKSRVR
jgi:hypothetical protein